MEDIKKEVIIEKYPRPISIQDMKKILIFQDILPKREIKIILINIIINSKIKSNGK